MAKILIVDDDPKVRKLLETLLRAEGQDPTTAGDGQAALELLAAQTFDLMISDIRMAPMDGMELLRKARAGYPHLPIVMLTAYGTVETAKEAVRCGAFDYLTKPFKVDDLSSVIKRALADMQKKAELAAGVREAEQPPRMMDAVVAESEAMRRVCEHIRRVAPTDVSVLLSGESGTGKELLARILHANSRRRDKPWVPVNCASLTAADVEGILFAVSGYGKNERPDPSAAPQGGTLFLDNVSCLSLAQQDILLKVMRARELRSAGGTAPLAMNIRVVAATDFALEERIRDGSFLQDLYLRLAAIAITVPPLRDRPEDILPLVQHFLRSGAAAGEPLPRIPHAVTEVLERYSWPGNVRELANTIKHAITFMTENEITIDSLPPCVVARTAATDVNEIQTRGGSTGKHVFLRAFLQRNHPDAPGKDATS